MEKQIVYHTTDQPGAKRVEEIGLTCNCNLETVSADDFFEERSKCCFAWLSLEQARKSEFGHITFEIHLNPQDAFVADFSIAVTMFIICTRKPKTKRCMDLIQQYKKTMRRLSEYLANGDTDNVEVLITKPIPLKDIKLLEIRQLPPYATEYIPKSKRPKISFNGRRKQ